MDKSPGDLSVRIASIFGDDEALPTGSQRLPNRRRYALAGLIGLPAMAGVAEGVAAELPYYCTEDADTIAMLESGSSAAKLFFSNQPATARERQVEGERACFPLGEAENYYYESAYPGVEYLPLVSGSQTIAHLLQRYPPLAVEGGQGTLTFTIRRNGALAQPSSLAFAIGGTATQGIDYSGPGGTAGVTSLAGVIEFASGETAKTITLNLQNDSDVEEEETIEVSLSSPSTVPGYEATVLGVTEGAFDVYHPPFVSPSVNAGEPARVTTVILDDDLLATRIPPRFWCTTNAKKVGPLLQNGSSVSGVYMSQDESLAEEAGVYCASVWTMPSILTTNSTNISINSSNLTTTSTNISINSSTIGAATGSISINSSNISTNSPNITVTPRISRIDPGDGSANIYFSGGLTSHTASCTPTGGGAPVSATSTHSPITLTGLANGVVYSCVVSVTGTLTVSSAATVTPTAAAPGAGEPRPVFVFVPWVLALLSGLLGLLGIGARRRWK